MAIKSVMKYMDGYMPIVEAVDGEYLLGGQMVSDSAVFEKFFDALYVMNEEIKDNLKARRRVKLGKVVPYRGMVSSFIHVPDRPMPRGPIPD